MSELHDPPLRITVEGFRWPGSGDWCLSGRPASFDLLGTDAGVPAEILLLLRGQLATRLQTMVAMLSVKVADLDFDAPNAPTDDDIVALETTAQTVLATIEALREMAPEVVDDDDTDEDPEDPEPDPALGMAERTSSPGGASTPETDGAS